MAWTDGLDGARRGVGLEGDRSAQGGIPMAEIVSALSFALDLTEDAVPGHAVRSCLFGMRIAEELGLGVGEKSALYYALLLKDVGCSSNAARTCQIIGADERRLKREVKFEDWTRATWSGTKMIWRNMMPEAGPLTKVVRLAQIGLQQRQTNQELIEIRCDRGASIMRKIGLNSEAAEAVRCLDEHWDGSGFPDGRKGRAIPLAARILLIAQHLDVFSCEYGAVAALHALEERSGRWFDPELVAAARSLDRRGVLWKGLGEASARAAVLDLEPGERTMADPARVDCICEAFADVVDAKSSFTFSHSIGVTGAAMQIGEQLGLAPERRELLYRAALLHDLGKLRVPNSVLDKPGKLDAGEWQIVQEYPMLTRRILERIGAFRELAIIAGQHHEKLDGSGYPDGLRANDLSPEARILAVADVYGALSEDRPYRAALSLEEIRSIMRRDIPTKLDPDCFEALMAALHGGGEVAACAAGQQARPPQEEPEKAQFALA